MSDIFISYASEDRPKAMMLAQILERQGWSVFWDRRIPTGKSWRETVGKELAKARCVVVLWSKTSIESSWVQDEADDAKRREVLFPVLIESVLPPFGFRSVQAADLTNWDGKDATQQFEWLMSDLVNVVGSPRARSLPKGWFAAGGAPNDYEMDFEGDGQTGRIKSRDRPRDFGTPDDDYRSVPIPRQTRQDDWVRQILAGAGLGRFLDAHRWSPPRAAWLR